MEAVDGVMRVGVRVVKWWHGREVFVDPKCGNRRKGRRDWVGRGSSDQHSIILAQNSERKSCWGELVENMVRDVANRMRSWVTQNDVLVVCGGGEPCWGRIGVVV